MVALILSFYALGVGLGIATDALWTDPLTFGFDVRFSDLAAMGRIPVRFPPPIRTKGCDLLILTRRSRP